jgi:hypothetical protein
MSVIHGQRPLATGMDTATQAIRRAQDRFAVASAEIARQSATSSDPPAAKEKRETSPLAQTPPNPGPPGGAEPSDLAEAMVNQNLAAHELTANVKTLQAFDAMLEELSRLKSPPVERSSK